MALDSPDDRGAAGVVVTAAPPDAMAEGRQPSAIGPWRLAGRRLRRNKVALAFLALFVVLVVLCLLAPVYSDHIAGIGPNTTTSPARSASVASRRTW